MEKIKKRKKYKQEAQKKKLHTYVSIEDIQRLETIKHKYGFKSTYQILQHLTHCFLRVADPENDPIIEPIQDEIQDMFSGFSEAEKHIYHKTKVHTISPDDIK